MFVELAAECLEHGHEGRNRGQRASSLVVAAGVLGASHHWLECGKMSKAERAIAEFYAQDFAEVFPFMHSFWGSSAQNGHSTCQVVICKLTHICLRS